MFFTLHPGGRGCGPRGGRGGRGGFGPAGDFMMGWGMGAPGSGGGRRRMFDGGELRLVLLRLIVDEPRHGYDLIREIEARTGGAYAPSPGVVYPTLTLLADMGLIEERSSEGAKKLFGATPAGEAHLAEQATLVADLMARLEALGAMRERTESGPVRRAMGNLKTALRDRLAHDQVRPDMLHDVAAIIDEAVQKIERLK